MKLSLSELILLAAGLLATATSGYHSSPGSLVTLAWW